MGSSKTACERTRGLMGRPMMTCGSVALIGLSLSVATAARAQPAAAEPAPPPDTSSAAPAQAPAAEGAPAQAPSGPGAATEQAPTEAAAAEPPATEDQGVVSAGGGLFEEGAAGTGSPSGQASAASASTPLSFELNGFVRGDAFIGKVPDGDRGEIKAGYGELALQLRAKAGSDGDAYAEARLRHGQQGDARELFLDLREAYADLYWGALDLRLGHQIIVWGRADGINPTNNLTPVDWRIRSPNEDDRRLANFGARAFLKLDPVRLEGVWMPVYRAVELPPLEYPSFITFGEPQFPAPQLQNGEWAGKVNLELSSFEMSASFVRGYAPLPGIVRTSFGRRPPEVSISRRAYKHHVVGFDFSTSVFDPVMVRGEAAYRHPANRAGRRYVPHPDLTYVLGADRGFGPVHVIAQYMGRYVFGWKHEPGFEDTGLTDLLGGADSYTQFLRGEVGMAVDEELAQRNQTLFQQTARVQHMLMGRIEWLTLRETLSLQAQGLYNFTTDEWVLYPKLAYRVTDQLTTTVGGEIYAGPEDTLFGLIDETLTAGYAELKCSF